MAFSERSRPTGVSRAGKNALILAWKLRDTPIDGNGVA